MSRQQHLSPLEPALPRHRALADLRAAFLVSPTRWLIAVTFATVGFFITVGLVARHSAAGIDEAANFIATNGAPSVLHLAHAREDLRHTEALVSWAVGEVAEGRPYPRPAIERARTELHEAVKAYESLPPSPGEREMYAPIDVSLADLDKSVAAMETRLSANDVAGARTERTREMQIADRTALALQKAADFNADQILHDSARITWLRHRTKSITDVLRTAAVIFAALLVVLGVRASLSFVRLENDRYHLAEGRARELEQFAGRVAHDLRNPLSALQLKLQIERRRHDQEAALIESFDRLALSASQMNLLIDGLLDFSLSGGQPRLDARCDPKAVIDEVTSVAREKAARVGAVIEVEYHATLVACTEGALTSVLSNLVENAVKYIVDGLDPKRIVVRGFSVDGVVAGKAGNGRAGNGAAVRFEVDDTGPGIPDGERRVIFEPFARVASTRHHPGLGLGLATVKRIVDSYGGRVGVESTPGHGSRFWCEFPAYPRA